MSAQSFSCPCGCSAPDVRINGRVKLSSDSKLHEALDAWLSTHDVLDPEWGSGLTQETMDWTNDDKMERYKQATHRMIREGCRLLKCVWEQDYKEYHSKPVDPDDPEEEYHERRRLFDELMAEMDADGELPTVEHAERDPSTADLGDMLNDELDIPEQVVQARVDQIMEERKRQRQQKKQQQEHESKKTSTAT